MRLVARFHCFAWLLIAPAALASDFVETQQELQDSGRHASMQGARIATVENPIYREQLAAFTALTDCIKAALKASATARLDVTCAAPRKAYAAFLPKEFADLELNMVDQALVQSAATADAE